MTPGAVGRWQALAVAALLCLSACTAAIPEPGFRANADRDKAAGAPPPDTYASPNSYAYAPPNSEGIQSAPLGQAYARPGDDLLGGPAIPPPPADFSTAPPPPGYAYAPPPPAYAYSPPSPVISSPPVPNPEDMSPEERLRVYGPAATATRRAAPARARAARPATSSRGSATVRARPAAPRPAARSNQARPNQARATPARPAQATQARPRTAQATPARPAAPLAAAKPTPSAPVHQAAPPPLASATPAPAKPLAANPPAGKPAQDAKPAPAAPAVSRPAPQAAPQLAAKPQAAQLPAAPAPAQPVRPSTPADRLGQALAGQVGAGSSLSYAAPAVPDQPYTVTLALPSDLFSVLRREASKLGLGRKARTADVVATLQGQNYEITPDGPQTVHLQSGKAPTFTWAVKPQKGANGQLDAKVEALLKGQGAPAHVSLGGIERRFSDLADHAATQAKGAGAGLSALDLPNVGPISLPGVGTVQSGVVVAGLIVLFLIVLIVAMIRAADDRRRQQEILRRRRTMAQNRHEDPTGVESTDVVETRTVEKV